ncbi:hypothetical protein FIBSPDRAFT_906522 [Athelia psychrophila]|uniref:Uncharacterized protein n=1 Tax=Athelia psychrophila TaxID=1759441 RepID=A0A166X6D3_9AGAM|nr:hypothetical protein FIBSPDRAFT_906522 [Fibularhizoctonia sp. CBS 109695]
MSSLKATPVVSTLLARSSPAPLSPSRKWRPELSDQIDALEAMLHLLNDDFNSCHDLAQTQEDNPYSCHLHAIVHRREPDYWNSKYWIARSNHRHMPHIYGPTTTSSVSQAKKAAEAFVDQVQSAAHGKSVEQGEAKQWAEMTALANILLEIEGTD